jgi:electron transfer flavoprotein beta subunit
VNNNTSFDVAGVQWIINPWDELTLTRALELKEASGGSIDNVTVICVGLADSEPTIRKALAIGADQAIRVNANPVESYFVAHQLAEVVKKENFDLILCGIDSSDYNGASVGGMLSELTGKTSVSSVSFIDFQGGKFSLKREIDGGQEMIEVNPPIIAVGQKGITKEPRIPSMRGVMMARTKPLQVVEPVQSEVYTEYVSYDMPKAKAACKMIDPENAGEVINLLHTEAKVI